MMKNFIRAAFSDEMLFAVILICSIVSAVMNWPMDTGW